MSDDYDTLAIGRRNYAAKVADHASEAIKILIQIYSAGFALLVTAVGLYLTAYISPDSKLAGYNSLRYFILAACSFSIPLTWLIRRAVETTFVIYERNMLIVLGAQSDRMLNEAVSGFIWLGKLLAVVITIFLGLIVGIVWSI